MSTSYDIKCIDCNVYMGWMHSTVHLKNMVDDMRKSAIHLAIMGDLIEQIGSIGNSGLLEVQLGFPRELKVPFEFFKVHAKHELRTYNEYGYDVTECHKYVKCDGCNHTNPCKLKLGHDGPCDTKKQ